MKAICLFNNKGGVGKTTLTCNIAAHFAKRYAKKVLLIDADPQCNATQLVLGDKHTADYYLGQVADEFHTILKAVQPILDGDAAVDTDVRPWPSNRNRFGVDLLPGHPRLSVIEDRLSQAWYEGMGGDLGGIRKSNWCYSILQHFADSYDVIFVDLGPSLGSINRSILLASDYFVTPLGADVFSLIGIRNIADWLEQWAERYKAGLAACEQQFPGRMNQYPVRQSVGVRSGFVGYTMQQYITKSKAGERRPTDAFEKILANVPHEISTSLGTFVHPGAREIHLGDVPNMYSLIPLAQSVNAPIMELQYKDGLVGAQYRQADSYAHILDVVAANLAQNIGFTVEAR